MADNSSIICLHQHGLWCVPPVLVGASAVVVVVIHLLFVSLLLNMFKRSNVSHVLRLTCIWNSILHPLAFRRAVMCLCYSLTVLFSLHCVLKVSGWHHVWVSSYFCLSLSCISLCDSLPLHCYHDCICPCQWVSLSQCQEEVVKGCLWCNSTWWACINRDS